MVLMPNSSEHIQVPLVQKHSNPFAAKNLLKKTGIKLNQIVALPKAVESLSRLAKKPYFTASVNKNPFAGMNYLVMWIICLVLAVVFLALAYFPIIGILFDILGVIAGVFFIVFFLLWILQIVQG